MKLLHSVSKQFISPTAASLAITLIVAAGAFVAKAVGLGKELLVAYKLGAGAELDAFLYAYTFPAFLVAVIVGGVAASFIPRYLATETEASPHDARRLAGELATIVALVTGVLVASPFPATHVPMLAGGFDDSTKSLAVRLVPILSPLLIFSVFTSMWSSLLNAHRDFTTAAFVPVVTPLVVLLALYGQVGSSGAISLAIGTAAGALIEASILAVRTRAAGLELFHLPRRWRREYGLLLRQFMPAAGGTVLMSATLVIDQSFAANLPAGSVSAFSYGTKLAGVAASILVVVVSTLSLPMFSRLAAEGNYVRLKRAYFTACALTVLITIPIAAILAIGAEPILRLLFLRGNFTVDDAALAASVQSVHAWHVVPYILSMVAVRALAAIAETWVLLVGAVANLAVDLMINILLVPTLGVVAVGFASTAMYLVSGVVLSVGFILRLRGLIAASR